MGQPLTMPRLKSGCGPSLPFLLGAERVLILPLQVPTIASDPTAFPYRCHSQLRFGSTGLTVDDFNITGQYFPSTM